MQVGWDVDNLKVLFKDSKVCESCCPSTPTPPDPIQGPYVNCTNCPGEIEPNYIYVSFRNLSNWNCFLTYFGGSLVRINYGDIVSQLNGNHVLTQYDNCEWRKIWVLDTPIQGVLCANAAPYCEKNCGTTYVDHFQIQLKRTSSSNIRLSASAIGADFLADIDSNSGYTYCVENNMYPLWYANESTSTPSTGGEGTWSIYPFEYWY